MILILIYLLILLQNGIGQIKIYFLKLSKISFATSLQPNQKAKPQAIVTIDINPIKIVFTMELSIHTFSSTIIKTKNIIINFAQEAIILAVFCFVKFNEW